METRQMRLAEIQPNRGQIEGLPKNPRKWGKAELDRLKRSITDTPELMDARGLIVIAHEGKYVVLSGNMRYAAVKALGWEEVTVHIIPEDTPLRTQKDIVMKDNQAFGAWDYDELANGWSDAPLDQWGVKAWVVPSQAEDPAPASQGPAEPTEDQEPAATEEMGRIIIVYEKEDEETMAELLGLERIDKIVYSINEIGGTE